MYSILYNVGIVFVIVLLNTWLPPPPLPDVSSEPSATQMVLVSVLLLFLFIDLYISASH